jgi:hypothetical protein
MLRNDGIASHEDMVVKHMIHNRAFEKRHTRLTNCITL